MGGPLNTPLLGLIAPLSNDKTAESHRGDDGSLIVQPNSAVVCQAMSEAVSGTS